MKDEAVTHIRSLVQHAFDELVITQAQRRFLRESIDKSIVAKLQVNIKVHKNPMASRPIVSLSF